MIKIYQANDTPDASLVACVLSIMELTSRSEEPKKGHIGMPESFDNIKHLLNSLDSYVRPYALELVMVKKLELDPETSIRGYYIMLGYMPDRNNPFNNMMHAVIAKNGKIVHDPDPLSDGSGFIPKILIGFLADMDQVKRIDFFPTQIPTSLDMNTEYFYFDKRPGIHRIFFSGVVTTINPFIEDGITYWQIDNKQALMCVPESELIRSEDIVPAYRKALIDGITKFGSDYTSVYIEAWLFSGTQLDDSAWFHLITDHPDFQKAMDQKD